MKIRNKSVTPDNRVGPSFPVWGLPSGCLLLLSLSLASALPAADRITQPVDNGRRVALPGHVSPRLKSAVDWGPVDPSMELPYVTMVLKPSASQQADLDQLLAQQQDPASPNYHRWLTPEQYADRFGVSQSDIDKIVAWLGRYSLSVKSVARGRNAIAFGGAAGQIGSAFGIEIHSYVVGGETHYANANDPTIPVAFQDVVLAVHGLHDFRLKPRQRAGAHPRDTIGAAYALAPDDITTIYDIAPLYTAGIDGTGQKLVITGQTNINLSDIEQYRTFFDLPANTPTVTLAAQPDPGIVPGQLAEADIDLELSGAVARNASILFVYSANVIDALHYAIDQNLAPVISISYGSCELQTESALATELESWGKQANSQGQTIFASSGDAGAADCFGGTDPNTNNSLSVDIPASLPEVTAVGGSEFNEGNGSFWNLDNTSSQASALSYIPETSWNDSVAARHPDASGGGASVYFCTGSSLCLAGAAKPSWQTGTGVPGDGARDVPDVSLSASNYHDSYQIYTNGQFEAYGGTSCTTPQFAGIAALLNQYLTAKGFQASPGLGNINPALYVLAPNPILFHDITTGNNIVDPAGTPIGFSAGVGYDQVTGLGTPDVYNMVTAWHAESVTSKQTPTMTLEASAGSVTYSGTTILTATVKSSGGAVPTGTVTFSTGDFALGTATLNAGAVATLTLIGAQLAAGANGIMAQYEGNTSYYGATALASVTVTSPTGGIPYPTDLLNAGSYTDSVAPGAIMAVYGSELTPNGVGAGAPSVPLPIMLAGTAATVNGIPAPLYYASPGQLNIQVPYDVPANSTAVLKVENNGQSATYNFNVASAAPAIFTTNAEGTGQGAILNLSYQLVDSSHPATPGSTYLQIYCMGLGAVTNQPANGAASPSSQLAYTKTPTQVTVGGVTVPATDVVFSGLAPGFVGLYQVDALVPASVAPGSAVPVVISVGGATSNTVTIAVGP
jgi:uncharacterized protein (TIGR03437 family)